MNTLCNSCVQQDTCETAEILGGDNGFPITHCKGYLQFSESKPTNADRIRAMSDEELAEWLDATAFKATNLCWALMGDKTCNKACMECWFEWLRKECEDGNTR